MQASAVHTPAAFTLAPVMLRSTKLPAAIATEPVAGHDPPPPDDAEHDSEVSTMLPEGPARSVTVIVCCCCEKTYSAVAVHPVGTQVKTPAGVCAVPISVALEMVLFTEK